MIQTSSPHARAQVGPLNSDIIYAASNLLRWPLSRLATLTLRGRESGYVRLSHIPRDMRPRGSISLAIWSQGGGGWGQNYGGPTSLLHRYVARFQMHML